MLKKIILIGLLFSLSAFADQGTNKAIVSDASGNLVASVTTATEVGYVNGVSSALQTQLNAKAPAASPTFSGTIGTALSNSACVVTDGSGNLTASSTTATEIGYVHSVTSAIQTQLNTKAPLASPTFSGTIGTALTSSSAVATDGSGNLAASTTTATELGYVHNVTSAIQTQLNAKAPLASPTFSGTIGTPLTSSSAVATDGSGNLAASSTTSAELGFVHGVTSAIQTQLNAVSAFNPSTTLQLYDDFLTNMNGGTITVTANYGQLNWNLAETSTADTVISQLSPNLSGHPGIISFGVTGASSAYAQLMLGAVGSAVGMYANDGTYIYETDVYIPTLASVGNSYVFRAGLLDNFPGDANNGIFFKYDRTSGVSATNWLACLSNNTVTNCVDTTILVSATTWYKLRFTTAATPSADFYVNGVKRISAATTDFPNTASTGYVPAYQMQMNAGTSARSVYIDYFYLQETLTTAR